MDDESSDICAFKIPKNFSGARVKRFPDNFNLATLEQRSKSSAVAPGNYRYENTNSFAVADSTLRSIARELCSTACLVRRVRVFVGLPGVEARRRFDGSITCHKSNA